MAGSSREKVASRPADKQESGNTTTRIFKGDKGSSKGGSRGKRVRMREEKRLSR